MANARRGEIAALIGGVERRLRLTLGALAELEEAFGAEDLGDLAGRFASGRLKARDALAVIGAGLRGAGETVTDQDVAGMAVDGGVHGYADIVIRLLAATFGLGETGESGERTGGDHSGGDPGGPPRPAGPAGAPAPAPPSPGTR